MAQLGLGGRQPGRKKGYLGNSGPWRRGLKFLLKDISGYVLSCYLGVAGTEENGQLLNQKVGWVSEKYYNQWGQVSSFPFGCGDI